MKAKWTADIMRHVGVGLLILVGVMGMAFSAINTYNLFQSIFGYSPMGVMLSIAGLSLFDIGLVGWVVFAVSSARGLIQRMASWAAALACLILTLTAAGTEVVMTQTLTDKPEWIGVAALVSIYSYNTLTLTKSTTNHSIYSVQPGLCLSTV